MSYIKSNEFVELCYEAEFNLTKLAGLLSEHCPSYSVRPQRLEQRIANYRRKGLLPLDSGNSVSHNGLSFFSWYDEIHHV